MTGVRGVISTFMPDGEEVMGPNVLMWHYRSPKLTVLYPWGIERVWFLLHRGQFRCDLMAIASAILSTGV
jgi:hypothetical protein